MRVKKKAGDQAPFGRNEFLSTLPCSYSQHFAANCMFLSFFSFKCLDVAFKHAHRQFVWFGMHHDVEPIWLLMPAMSCASTEWVLFRRPRTFSACRPKHKCQSLQACTCLARR